MSRLSASRCSAATAAALLLLSLATTSLAEECPAGVCKNAADVSLLQVRPGRVGKRSLDDSEEDSQLEQDEEDEREGQDEDGELEELSAIQPEKRDAKAEQEVEKKVLAELGDKEDEEEEKSAEKANKKEEVSLLGRDLTAEEANEDGLDDDKDEVSLDEREAPESVAEMGEEEARRGDAGGLESGAAEGDSPQETPTETPTEEFDSPSLAQTQKVEALSNMQEEGVSLLSRRQAAHRIGEDEEGGHHTQGVSMKRVKELQRELELLQDQVDAFKQDAELAGDEDEDGQGEDDQSENEEELAGDDKALEDEVKEVLVDDGEGDQAERPGADKQ